VKITVELAPRVDRRGRTKLLVDDYVDQMHVVCQGKQVRLVPGERAVGQLVAAGLDLQSMIDSCEEIWTPVSTIVMPVSARMGCVSGGRLVR